MGATTLVTHVLAQFEEVLDVKMPGLEVGTHGPLALTSLIDGHGRIVGHLEKGNDTLALAVGPLDQGARGPDIGPVITEAAGPLRELRIIADALEDVVEVIHHRGEVAGAELRMQGSAVEQGRRRGGEEELREEFVELDGTLVFLVTLVD